LEKLSRIWVLSSKSRGKCEIKSQTVFIPAFAKLSIYLSVVLRSDLVSLEFGIKIF
jgi:hypothetical protein